MIRENFALAKPYRVSSGPTMNWDSGPVLQSTHPHPKKPFGCVEFNNRFDKTKHDYLDTTRDYDYTNKFRWMRSQLMKNDAYGRLSRIQLNFRV